MSSEAQTGIPLLPPVGLCANVGEAEAIEQSANLKGNLHLP